MRKIRADNLVTLCKKKLTVNDINEILGLNISEKKYDDFIEIDKNQELSLFGYIKKPGTKK